MATTTAANPAALPADAELAELRAKRDRAGDRLNEVLALADAFHDERAAADRAFRAATTEKARAAARAKSRELNLRQAEIPDEAAIAAEAYAGVLIAWARAAIPRALAARDEAQKQANPLLKAQRKPGAVLEGGAPIGAHSRADKDAAQRELTRLADQIRPLLARRDAGQNAATLARRELQVRFGDHHEFDWQAPVSIDARAIARWVDGIRRQVRDRLAESQ